MIRHLQKSHPIEGTAKSAQPRRVDLSLGQSLWAANGCCSTPSHLCVFLSSSSLLSSFYSAFRHQKEKEKEKRREKKNIQNALHVHHLLPDGSTRIVWAWRSPVRSSGSFVTTMGGTVRLVNRVDKSDKSESTIKPLMCTRRRRRRREV